MLLQLIAHVLGLAPISVVAFSGEDPIVGHPWHHEQLTREATLKVGFAPEVVEVVAWHADYVDSYLYNPLWWVQGGLDRLKISLATRGELVKVHFDDLVSGDHVRYMWRRYLGGTVAGLLWAQEHNDVAAARNIVGVSLHAIQDFYSHSDWVDDPGRRPRTWFQVSPQARNTLPLWTGTYEQPDHLGIKPHGKPAPWCAIMKTPSVSAFMELACSVFSPLNQSSMCQVWRECQGGQIVHPRKVLGVDIPDNIVYLEPPGIALDNTWMAAIGVQQRGVTDVSGEELFDIARGRAEDTSVQWLKRLEGIMQQLGMLAFWQAVKTTAPVSPKEHEYEHYDRFPYMFLTTGSYPPTLDETGDEYYLRVRLSTSTDADAGTDADIYLLADGAPLFHMDYLPDANPAIAYNDFEAGDVTAYMVGPFQGLPPAVTLENRSANAGEVLVALGQTFVSAIEDVITASAAFLLSLIGGHADLVKTNKRIWSPAELSQIGYGGTPFECSLEGGDEGHYVVHGTISRTAEGAGTSSAENWIEYSVRLDRLECKRESKFDRFSSSDEPFVLALLVPLPGAVQPFRTEPFMDVDTGESRTIDHVFAPVRVPRDYGMLSLPITVLESDDESRSARDDLLNTFADTVRAETDQQQRAFTTTLGAAIAADWKLAHLEVYAFTCGRQLRTGTVFDGAVDRWIKGGDRATFTLDDRALKNWTIKIEPRPAPGNGLPWFSVLRWPP